MKRLESTRLEAQEQGVFESPGAKGLSGARRLKGEVCRGGCKRPATGTGGRQATETPQGPELSHTSGVREVNMGERDLHFLITDRIRQGGWDLVISPWQPVR